MAARGKNAVPGGSILKMGRNVENERRAQSQRPIGEPVVKKTFARNLKMERKVKNERRGLSRRPIEEPFDTLTSSNTIALLLELRALDTKNNNPTPPLPRHERFKERAKNIFTISQQIQYIEFLRF